MKNLKIFLPIMVLASLLAPWQGSHAYALENSSRTADVSIVEVKEMERGTFLALIPVTFTITARAKPDGTIELDYPWYSFMTLDNHERIKTDIQVAVPNALRLRLVGSVQALRTTPQERFSPEEAAVVSHEMSRVLKANFEGITMGTIGG